MSCKRIFTLSHIVTPSLIKLVESRWLDIGVILFCEFMDLDSISVHKRAEKKNLADIQPSGLDKLVNNPYIFLN